MRSFIIPIILFALLLYTFRSFGDIRFRRTLSPLGINGETLQGSVGPDTFIGIYQYPYLKDTVRSNSFFNGLSLVVMRYDSLKKRMFFVVAGKDMFQVYNGSSTTAHEGYMNNNRDSTINNFLYYQRDPYTVFQNGVYKNGTDATGGNCEFTIYDPSQGKDVLGIQAYRPYKSPFFWIKLQDTTTNELNGILLTNISHNFSLCLGGSSHDTLGLTHLGKGLRINEATTFITNRLNAPLNGAVDGYVLTTDSFGNATWQNPVMSGRLFTVLVLIGILLFLILLMLIALAVQRKRILNLRSGDQSTFLRP